MEAASRAVGPAKGRIEIRNVSVSFGAHPVLKEITLEVQAGEFFAFLGPSGSGKSTLLRLIAGFGPPPAGEVLLDGRPITRMAPWERPVGMVFQNYALWPHLSVADNVAFGLVEKRLPRQEIARKVAEVLTLVGLADYGARRPSQLSGGQQQRVALARTLVVEPTVLLLDEPLSNLDAKLRVQMRLELLQMQRTLGLTTVYVTHDQEEALTMADRIAVLDGGIIQQVGAPSALYDHPANRFVAEFLGTTSTLRGRLVAAGDGLGFETPEGLRVPVREPTRLAPGSEAYLFFRPQAAQIAEPGGPQPNRIRLEGTVRHREFLGGYIRYFVRVGAEEVRVDAPHVKDHTDLQVGQPIVVSVDLAQITLIPT